MIIDVCWEYIYNLGIFYLHFMNQIQLESYESRYINIKYSKITAFIIMIQWIAVRNLNGCSFISEVLTWKVLLFSKEMNDRFLR